MASSQSLSSRANWSTKPATICRLWAATGKVMGLMNRQEALDLLLGAD